MDYREAIAAIIKEEKEFEAIKILLDLVSARKEAMESDLREANASLKIIQKLNAHSTKPNEAIDNLTRYEKHSKKFWF